MNKSSNGEFVKDASLKKEIILLLLKQQFLQKVDHENHYIIIEK